MSLSRLAGTVATTGTSQQLIATATYAAYVCIQAMHTNTQKLWVTPTSGTGTNAGTSGKLIQSIDTTQGGTTYTLSDHCGRNIFDLSQFYISGLAGDGVVVLYWVNPAYSDRDMFNEMQYHLLETPNQGASMGSAIWDMTEVLDEANAAYRRLASEARLYTYYGSQPVTAGTADYDMDEFFVGNLCGAQCVDVLRLAFIDSTGKSHALQPSDPFVYDFATGNTAATPTGYSLVTTTDTRTVRLHPTPSASGTLECLYSGYGLDLTATGTFMTLPEEVQHLVKWGGLSALLAYEGQGHDPVRAAYCRERFDEGIELCRMLTGDWYA